MQSGVATQPIKDIDAYRDTLKQTVVKSAFLMRPVFEAASSSARRIVFSEGEDERVLRAAQAVLEDTSEVPIVIGRPEVIQQRCERLGLDIRPDRDFNIVNPQQDDRYRDYWTSYHTLLARRGVSPDLAKSIMRTNTTAIGAVMVHRGEADSLICGAVGEFRWHLNYIEQILGSKTLLPSGALSLMILEDGPLFIADTHVWADPTPMQIAQTAKGAARHVRRFGIEPQVALCSQSQFGNLNSETGKKMRQALDILDTEKVAFTYEGEMNIDTALDPDLRARLLPENRLQGAANVLIFANADAASGVRNILKMRAGGLEVGPILMGMGNKAHIANPSVTARGLLNLAAIAGTDVKSYE
jgi:malate dehydrogenase (oxaloacetate-decarboxylating)(NADP+)